MKIDYIEAKTSKELASLLNNLVQHITHKYTDEPYLFIHQDIETKRWVAFVGYNQEKIKNEL